MAERCEYSELLDDAIKNNQIIQYDYNTFNEITHIGRGSSGFVFSAKSPEFETRVALKSIKIDPSYTIELLINELKQHIHIGSHNNILEFYGISKNEPNEFILVLEYAANGTLKTYLCVNFYVLNWNDKLHIAKQLAEGIKFLHSHDIIHRDLHSENVLIHNKIVKLCDFGNSKFTADPSIQLTKAIGALRYSDPKFLDIPNYSRTKKSDIYSLGVLLWQISSGREPFESKPLLSLISGIISGLREKPVYGTPKDYVVIYEECWTSIPDQRPTIEETVSNLENINVDNVISVDEIELEDNRDNNEPATISIIQKLISKVNDGSEAYHNLNDALSSVSKAPSAEPSNSTSKVKALNSIIKIDPKIFEYIDNNIDDSNKQFLRQLMQLFVNYSNISEEPKFLIIQITNLIKNYNENSDKVFKILLKYQGQPAFAYSIGFFYEHGIGVKINQRKAQKMYKQAKEYENNIQNQSNKLKPIYRITKSMET
ncbi:12216_t:CDS:2, partial [Cetraspora pellucida]